MLYRLLIWCLLPALWGCSGSNRFYKYGNQLQEAGLYREASNRYMESLRRNRNNVNAQIALRSTGQRVLDDHLSEFYLAHTGSDHASAVRHYEQATHYHQIVSRYGVNLTFPDNYRPMFIESENVYLQQLYLRAQEFIDNERFSEAESTLKEISRLRSDYEDITELKNLAFVEPRYRQAMEAYDNLHYRQAYYLFQEIESRSPNYKDSRHYMRMAKDNAIFTVGLLPIENRSGFRLQNQQLEDYLMAVIMAEVASMDDPFLKLIDRSNVDQIIKEQRLSLEGVIEQRTAVMAGELLGARALLRGTLVNYSEKEGKLLREERKGYIGAPVRVPNPETGRVVTQIQYNKTLYDQFARENEVSLSFQFQLVSTESGEILRTDLIELRRSDRADFARYDGDTQYLFAGVWDHIRNPSANDRMYNSRQAKRELDQFLNTPDRVETVENLRTNIFKALAAQVARNVQEYNPEK